MKALYLFISLLCSLIACKEANSIVEKKSPDGKVQAVYTIDKKGRRNGIYKEFYPTGQLKLEVHFEKGLEAGKGIHYYDTGEIREIQYFSEGKRHGPDTLFDKLGMVKNISHFQQGLKHGRFAKFKEQSDSLDVESFYERDSLISVKKY
jgi:antitoxin component YwqK of YwqJK toxin-antitoxin module